jgi:hypothetical protein
VQQLLFYNVTRYSCVNDQGFPGQGDKEGLKWTLLEETAAVHSAGGAAQAQDAE